MPLQITAVDSVPGQTLTFTATGLPTGLSISSSGLITGTPSAQGTFTPVITATDSLGVKGTISFTWFIGPASGNVITVNNPGSQSGTAGVAISTLTITGTDSSPGSLPFTWSATGLPTGLAINSSSGAITGTPTAAGSFSVTVQAQDTTLATGFTTFTWTITGGGGNTVTVTNPGNKTNNVGSVINLLVTATDSQSGQTFTWSATGLPAGLSIGAATGRITGTIGTPAGTMYSVTVTATDTTSAHGAASFTWNVPGANVVTVTNPGAQSSSVGGTVSLGITATDSDSSQTLSYSATGLPAGLSINNSTGVISGSPTTTQTATNCTVRAVDTTGANGSATFAWTITAAPSIIGRVGMSVPNQAFQTGHTPPWYAAGRTQAAADTTVVQLLNRPRSPAVNPLVVKKFWNGGPGPGDPGDYHLNNSFNNMQNYFNNGTRVVACIQPATPPGLNARDPDGTLCNFTTSSQCTAAQKTTCTAEVQRIITFCQALKNMGFTSRLLRFVLYQEPANAHRNGQQTGVNMTPTDYANCWRTYATVIQNNSQAFGADGLPFPVIVNTNFDGGGPVSNTTDYANAVLGRKQFAGNGSGVTLLGLAIDYYTNSYYKLSAGLPRVTNKLLSTKDGNGESLADIADALGIGYGLHEFGTPPKQVDPQGVPDQFNTWTWGTQYYNYITGFMSDRVTAGKPNLDCIYYDGQGPPDGTGDITSPIGQDPTTGSVIATNPVTIYNDFRVPLHQAFFDAVNGH